MEITSSTTTTTTTAAAATEADTLTSDYETFLTMLATQMTNQDPLNPVDSTDFATQLAQFSALEQQVKTNDLLANLGETMAVSGLSQLSGWVGMEARTIAPANFEGTPITLVPSPASLSDQAFLIVRDENDDIVQRSEIPVSAEPIEWAGVDDDGNPFPDGLYSFELESVLDGEVLDTTYVDNYALIIEAQQVNDQIILVMDGGSRVTAEAISALRNAP